MIRIVDSHRNIVNRSGIIITAAITNGTGTLSGNVATTDSTGRASFTNLTITGSIGERTLTFTTPGLEGVSTYPITVTPGSARELIITTQPTPTIPNGTAFIQQPTVELRDISVNTVRQSGTEITARISDGESRLTGSTTQRTNSDGRATFTNLGIIGAIGDQTITFASARLNSVTSDTITVTPGGLNGFEFLAASGESIATEIQIPGTPFAIQVRAVDRSGNTVTSFNDYVTSPPAATSPTAPSPPQTSAMESSQANS
jgi:hypothetical protein